MDIIYPGTKAKIELLRSRLEEGREKEFRSIFDPEDVVVRDTDDEFEVPLKHISEDRRHYRSNYSRPLSLAEFTIVFLWKAARDSGVMMKQTKLTGDVVGRLEVRLVKNESLEHERKATRRKS